MRLIKFFHLHLFIDWVGRLCCRILWSDQENVQWGMLEKTNFSFQNKLSHEVRHFMLVYFLKCVKVIWKLWCLEIHSNHRGRFSLTEAICSVPESAKVVQMLDWLMIIFVYYDPLKKFSLIWRRHHCRWRATKYRPMFGARGPVLQNTVYTKLFFCLLLSNSNSFVNDSHVFNGNI
jgi:hypothetical protein